LRLITAYEAQLWPRIHFDWHVVVSGLLDAESKAESRRPFSARPRRNVSTTYLPSQSPLESRPFQALKTEIWNCISVDQALPLAPPLTGVACTLHVGCWLSLKSATPLSAKHSVRKDDSMDEYSPTNAKSLSIGVNSNSIYR
jgi:hypothetical protein